MYAYMYAGQGKTIVPGTIKPMFYQDGDGTWEPFTGGNPSPSPEYPQEIVNVGRMYNLFDKETGVFDGYVDTNGTITTLNTVKSVFVKVEPNTTYTIQKLSTTKFRVVELEEIPKGGVTGNILYNGTTNTRITITTSTANIKLLIV